MASIRVPFDLGQFFFAMCADKDLYMTIDPCDDLRTCGRRCDACRLALHDGDSVRSCCVCNNVIFGQELCADCYARDAGCKIHPGAAFSSPIILKGVAQNNLSVYVKDIRLGLCMTFDEKVENSDQEQCLLADSAVGLPFLVAIAHRQLFGLLDKAGASRATLLHLLLNVRDNRDPDLLCLLTEIAVRATKCTDLETLLVGYEARVFA